MNRTDLVYLVSRKANLSSDQAKEAIDAVINSIVDAVGNKENVTISRLGSFSCIPKSERGGHNPKTGQKITIPKRWAVRFRPAKSFKEAVESIDFEDI